MMWFMFWGGLSVAQWVFHLYDKLNPDKQMPDEGISRQVHVKGYLRPLFGLPPTDGKVVVRIGIAQILLIIFAVAGWLIAKFVDRRFLKYNVTHWLLAYMIVGGIIGAILNVIESYHNTFTNN